MTTNEEWKHPKCDDCNELMMLDSSEPYCQSCEDKNAGEEWVEKDVPIEENNDDCCVCGIILTDDDMYGKTGKCEECEREENECEICGKNMSEENTKYVEDSDTIIMCSDCFGEEEPPLREWDGDMKQTIVEVECRGCNTIYKDRQCRNDCVSAYPYEYPKKGFYWKENKECYKCYKKSLE